MFGELRIAVVVPAFNEELKVARTVREVPAFVDHVLVVDDASHDDTFLEASKQRRRGLEVLRHPRNRGVGAALATGYRRARELDVDVTCVMAGDGQMDPDDLPALIEPLARGEADYAKGNRFSSLDVLSVMPKTRVVGNVLLSLVTKLSSGYLHVFDSQCGYTAASRRALSVIEAAGMFPRYGYPNDLLARLYAARMRVVDVPVRAVYGASWRSGIRLSTVVYPMSFVLLRSFFYRLRPAPAPAPEPARASTEEPGDACASAS